MIAESLTRCGIPTRVYSFCTLNGCTVLRLFRDYEETSKTRPSSTTAQPAGTGTAWPSALRAG